MSPSDTTAPVTLGRFEFQRLRQVINTRAGLTFDDGAQTMFEKRLAERLATIGVDSFSDYIRLIESDPEEIDAVYTLLTTKETYFFRQEYQLEAFTKEVLPLVAKANGHHKRLTVWSAGCSTGEEAYTLAILLSESRLLDGWFLRVLGTDLCRQNIDAANRGVYKGNSFRTTPAHYLKSSFVAQGDGSYRIAEPLRRMCHFSHVNLLDQNAVRTVGRVDVVFCRNVIIYFDERSRQKVMAQVFQRLLPGGFLFLGHSESLLNVETPFVPTQLRGDVAYRRTLSIPPRWEDAMTDSLRVLVVDDSAVNRRSISDMLAEVPEVRIVGKAANGEEALRLVNVSEPDVITLDLEMPRMDGFTFLRILMAKKPLPVIVISSYSQKENVFKALELGALDFVAKPDLLVPGDLSIRNELVSKILMVRGLHKLKRPDPQFLRTRPPSMFPPAHAPEPSRVVVIGASTGGPSALMEVIGAMPEQTDMAFLIAQHMPEKFTRTFAERLDRRSHLNVREAEHDDPVEPGTVLICPGMRCMELARTGGNLRVRVFPPASTDRYYPSADRLFSSTAKVIGKDTIAVVLTGMADDGAKGALLVREAGGHVIAESDETAVVYGMPRAAVDNGAAHRSLPLHEIAAALVAMEKGGAPGGNARTGVVV